MQSPKAKNLAAKAAAKAPVPQNVIILNVQVLAKIQKQKPRAKPQKVAAKKISRLPIKGFKLPWQLLMVVFFWAFQSIKAKRIG